MKQIGMYIHIPFCKQKCKYCDFVSFAYDCNKVQEYFKYLLQEIEEKSNEIVLQKDSENNQVQKIKDIVEINPGTVNEEKLKKYLQIGINRISIGLQSANDKLLEMLGRIHTYEEFTEVYKLAREVGFKNINVDLMIGLPTQKQNGKLEVS